MNLSIWDDRFSLISSIISLASSNLTKVDLLLASHTLYIQDSIHHELFVWAIKSLWEEVQEQSNGNELDFRSISCQSLHRSNQNLQLSNHLIWWIHLLPSSYHVLCHGRADISSLLKYLMWILKSHFPQDLFYQSSPSMSWSSCKFSKFQSGAVFLKSLDIQREIYFWLCWVSVVGSKDYSLPFFSEWC